VVTGGCTKCSWTPSRSSKLPNGSKSTGNSGKPRSIASPPIWKRRTKQPAGRERADRDVSCVHRQLHLHRRGFDLGRQHGCSRSQQVLQEQTNQQTKREKMKLRQPELNREIVSVAEWLTARKPSTKNTKPNDYEN